MVKFKFIVNHSNQIALHYYILYEDSDNEPEPQLPWLLIFAFHASVNK